MNAEKNTRATRATLDKKTSDIAAMFDTVAERYDLMNGILSLGQHIYWRKQAVAAVDAHPGQKVLDVAAGTGVSSEPFADAGVDVIAADLSEGMLDVGRRRRPAPPEGSRRFPWPRTDPAEPERTQVAAPPLAALAFSCSR